MRRREGELSGRRGEGERSEDQEGKRIEMKAGRTRRGGRGDTEGEEKWWEMVEVRER